MENNSKPTSTPSNGTVDVPGLVASDEFLDSIMTALTPGKKEGETEKVPENVPEKIEEKIEENMIKEELSEENGRENVQENVQEKAPEKATDESVLEKRWKDAQSMIGRQANELGQLRKQVSEFQTKFEKSNETNDVPYYEKLLSNNTETLANQLNISKEQVETLQMAARIAKDIAKDEAKPLQKAANEIAVQREIQAKDAAWYQDHPDFKNRQPVMAKFLNRIFPNGPVSHGADPWQAAHMAYEHAGEVMNNIQQDVVNQNNQRIVNGRSVIGSTKGVDSSSSVKPPQKPVDAKTAEINKLFEMQAAQLIRR